MRVFTLFALCFTLNASGQFAGDAGVYYLGAADMPVAAGEYSNPDISGVVCRFRWESVEPSPGVFDWTFVDVEIQKAIAADKKISLQPLGYPSWIIDTLNAQPYYYIDENPNHSTYGQVVSGVLPWDSTYLARVKALIQELSAKYTADTTVSYLNLIGAQVSRNLPDTVLTDTTLLTEQPFWIAFGYNADSLAPVLYDLTDYYMSLFPNTPLWCSVDYVKFEFSASAHPVNYLASLYTSYGIANYPDRFGLFREDLSGCNPPPVINSGSHWYIMQQNPCATGAQMLWSVQDGPGRMNQCNMIPNTKSFVLDSAVQHGLTLGMRYLEIYGADIEDSTLFAVISSANTALIQKGVACMTPAFVKAEITDEVLFWPDPVSEEINLIINTSGYADLSIISMYGQTCFTKTLFSERGSKISLPAALKNGIYFIQVLANEKVSCRKFIVSRNEN